MPDLPNYLSFVKVLPWPGPPFTSIYFPRVEFRRTEIEERILGAGFTVEAKRRIVMTTEVAQQFYQVN